MTVSVYPRGIVPWTNRADKVNTVFAADPNALAAEIVAIETTLGTNAHRETAPPVGSVINYNTVAQRIHDVQMGNQLPVCSVSFGVQNVRNDGAQHRLAYTKVFDPFDMYNGTDITISATGWYHISGSKTIQSSTAGWHMVLLYVGGSQVDKDYWSWDFAQNGFYGSLINAPVILSVNWQGILHPGHQVSCLIINNSNSPITPVTTGTLKASYHRQVPDNARG